MRGFTLIELMVVILIFSMIAVAGVPAFNSLRDRLATDISKRVMQKTLGEARSWALSNNKPVVVCPLRNERCSASWNDPLAIFFDKNDDQILDSDDALIYQTPAHSPRGAWFKKKPELNYIKFNAAGHAFSSATTFIYCPDSKNLDNARQLIISFQGRLRTKSYLSSRGTPYANLRNLTCPQ